MNILQILGNLGGDPETRFTPSGQKITTFTMASNTRKQGKDETTWFRVTIFGDRFDKSLSYLKKGSSVIVIGKMNPPRIWTDKEGRPQVSLEIVADMVEFSPFGKGDRPAQEQQQQQQQQQTQNASYSSGYSQPQSAYAPQSMPPQEPSYSESSYSAPQSGFGGPSSFGAAHKPPQDEENIPF